jgi:hypothetical protein
VIDLSCVGMIVHVSHEYLQMYHRCSGRVGIAQHPVVSQLPLSELCCSTRDRMLILESHGASRHCELGGIEWFESRVLKVWLMTMESKTF